MWHGLKLREKLVSAVLVVGLSLLALRFIIIPQFGEYREIKSKLEEVLSRVKVAEDVVASYKSESDLAVMVAGILGEIKPLFDNDINDGLALLHIGLEAVKSDVQVVSFKPSNVIDKGTYLESSSRFEVCGNYRNVNNFIEKVEHMPVLSELRTLNIKGYGGGAAAQKQVNAQEETVTAFEGVVVAVFDLVTYTSLAPQGQLKIEQVNNWATGRYNAFLVPGSVSPYPGVMPLEKKPDTVLGPQNNNSPTSVYRSVYN